jgi:hypothetical protein
MKAFHAAVKQVARFSFEPYFYVPTLIDCIPGRGQNRSTFTGTVTAGG